MEVCVYMYMSMHVGIGMSMYVGIGVSMYLDLGVLNVCLYIFVLWHIWEEV